MEQKTILAEMRPTPSREFEGKNYPDLFSSMVHYETRNAHYAYMEQLGPLARRALDLNCRTSWSPRGVLQEIDRRGWDRDTVETDRKIAKEILKFDKLRFPQHYD